jgi:hypothetical protein
MNARMTARERMSGSRPCGYSGKIRSLPPSPSSRRGPSGYWRRPESGLTREGGPEIAYEQGYYTTVGGGAFAQRWRARASIDPAAERKSSRKLSFRHCRFSETRLPILRASRKRADLG